MSEAEVEPWEPSFMRLSPSKINTYMKCPREFYYKYIAKIPEKKTIHLFRGTLVHAVLEDLFKKAFRSFKAWEDGDPEKWMQEQFEKGWEDNVARHKWLWEIHSASEIEAMRLETKDILHIVEAGCLLSGPLGGAEGAVGEGFAAGGFVGEFKAFTSTGVDHSVIADDIAAAQAVHSNLLIGAFARDTFAAVAQGVLLLIAHIQQDFSKRGGRAAGGINLVAMMHFHDLEIVVWPQNIRCLAS